MAQMPKYMVVLPPGAPVAGVGFVQPGDIFTAPSVDYVPSRTFRAINEEAAKALDGVHAKVVAEAEKRAAAAKPDAKDAAVAALEEAKAARARAAQVFQLPKVEAQVEKGLTLKELGQSAAAEKAAPAARKL